MNRFTLPDNVWRVRARGKEYFYHQRNRNTKREGPRTPLPGCPFNPDGSPNADWWSLYRRLEGSPEPKARAGTFAALVDAYQRSPEWGQLKAKSTLRDYKRYCGIILRAWGDFDVRAIEPKHVLALRDAYADIPPADPRLYTKDPDAYLDRAPAANGLLRTLSALLSWGVPRGWRNDNPALHVPKLRGGDGYVAWPWEAIELFEKHAPPHLWWVAAHALYTGQRQGDVLAMRKSDMRDGMIHVVQDKGNKPLWIPVHRDLRAIQENMREHLAQSRDNVVSTHLLVSTRGTEWTPSGFRASWRAEMSRDVFDSLRAHRLVFHGLRKSAVVFLLEAGCTTAEVASITGQTMQMVEHYAQQVNQPKMGREAILKWEAAGRRTKNEREESL